MSRQLLNRARYSFPSVVSRGLRPAAQSGPPLTPSRPRLSILSSSLQWAMLGSVALAAPSGFAQDASASDTTQLQRVVVTGSNIRRTDTETPSPVQVITADDLKKSGYTSVQEVLHNVTANGQGTLSQSFSGAFASGAGGIALRGLTVGATLVLIDGHRMAPYPIGDDGQRSFVDIANIPLDSIERIEILKDGASAVYGSDAIAGVVNIILKRSFVGKTFTADLGTSGKNDGQTYHVAGTVGFGDLNTDGHNFYVAGELRKQNQILFADRGGVFTQTDYSASGGYNLTPGVINPLNSGLPRSGTGYVTAPGGTTVAGFMPGCNATQLAAGQCTYHDTWNQIQPPTENYNLVGRYTQNLGSDWQVSVQGTYFESKSQQTGAPSHTFTGGYQGITSGPGVTPALLAALPATTIPSTNPSFPAGTGLSSGTLYYTFLDLGPTITETDSRSTRLIADIQGHVGAWDVNGSVGYTEVALNVTGLNYVNPVNLQSALDSTTNPYLVGQTNSAAVDAFIAPTLNAHDVSKLSFAHVGAGRDLMPLGGGVLAVAAGADYVYRSQNALAPAGVAAGDYNSAFSNNYTVGTQTVASVYGELSAPFTKQLEADLAVRYDHYNLSGGRASPKIGLKYTPIPELAFRGTASLGFRAPGPAENGTAGQTFFAGSSSDPVLCPNPGNANAPGNFPSQCELNVGTVQGTNPALKPETSKSFTLGMIVEPVKDFSATLDLYSIEIDHQIVAGSSQDAVRGTNFTPIPYVNADGSTSLVAPPSAPIAYYQVAYVNANTTKTTGLDLGLQFRHKFQDVGDLKSDFMVTYMNKYDLTIDGVTYHLAGTHGPFITSGDTGNPKTRFQWANTFARGPWQVTGTVNYVGSFSVTDPSSIATAGEPADTCLDALSNNGGAASLYYGGVLANNEIPAGVSCKVKSFTTFDVSGKYEISKQLSIHGAIMNLFNASAPLDWATYGGALGAVPWNPSLHLAGAIGRYFNVGMTYNF